MGGGRKVRSRCLNRKGEAAYVRYMVRDDNIRDSALIVVYLACVFSAREPEGRGGGARQSERERGAWKGWDYHNE